MEQASPRAEGDESAHPTGCNSGRSARVEIITRGERRRFWTVEQRRAMVVESFGTKLTLSEMARKLAIGSGQLYTWHRELLGVQAAQVTLEVSRYAQVRPYLRVRGRPGRP